MMKECTLYVTSKCNLHCDECVMGKLMRYTAGYEMSLEELDAFLDISKRSNYMFNIIICGGEPLLWKHLNEGAKRIYQSGVANKIFIFSNAINIKQATPDVMQYVDEIRISRYDSNTKNCKKLTDLFQNKVRIVERREFWHLPTNFIKDTLPVECVTPENLYMKGKVFACPHSGSVNNGKDELDDGTKLYVPLQLNYLDHMDGILKQQERLCMKCISNVKVRELLGGKFKKRDNHNIRMM